LEAVIDEIENGPVAACIAGENRGKADDVALTYLT
jgi:hypothetical protein